MSSSEEGWRSTGSGAQPPLLSIHSWSGEEINDAALAGALGDRSVISLLRPDAATRPIPVVMEDWVSHYVALIDTLPVEAPYWLIGWSFGGVLALEVARALQARGVDVAYVGMIDAARPLRFSGQFRLFLRKVSSLPDWSSRARHISTRARSFVALVGIGLRENPREVARFFGLRSKRAPTQPSATKDDYAAAVHKCYLAYVPRPCELPVAIFASRRTSETLGGPSLGWAPFLPTGFQCFALEGAHRTMFGDEQITSTADAVARSLAIAAIQRAPKA